MTGPVEVPPGDPDGMGSAQITLDPARGAACVTFTVAGIADVSAAHIHTGAAGVAGPVVIDLPATAGCVTADPALLSAIVAGPAGYYVNVHNADHPKGALRGQLGPGAVTPVATAVSTSTGPSLHCTIARLA
jgi:CHRD domain